MNIKGNAKIAMIWIVVILMIGSTAGYVFLSGFTDASASTIKYGKYSFSQDERGYHTKINGMNFYFRYSPIAASEINISAGSAEIINNAKVIYITSDLYSPYNQFIGAAQYDSKYSLEKNLGKIAVIAFSNNNISVNAPYVTCKNATVQSPVISFELGEVDEVLLENNCVIVHGKDGPGFLIAKDRLFYQIVGVIE